MGDIGQHTDRDDAPPAGDHSSQDVQDDLEPDREEMDQVTGGRDAADGMATGKRQYKP